MENPMETAVLQGVLKHRIIQKPEASVSFDFGVSKTLSWRRLLGVRPAQQNTTPPYVEEFPCA